MTDAERKIWNILKNKQLFDLKFWRQYGVGDFILDFYCPQIRLAIEVDGGQHNEESSKEYDAQRSVYLKQKSIKIIRIWNNDVMKNIDGVYDFLLKIVRELYPLPSSPYIKGRGQASTFIKGEER